jgi:hypothetical protein
MILKDPGRREVVGVFHFQGDTMNRLAVLIAFLGMTAAHACLAEEPAFCKSMCASEQRQCRADAQFLPKEERLMPASSGSAFTRANQPNPSPSLSADARGLLADGDNHRRLARGSACDTTYQRCVRSCDNPKEGSGAVKGKHEPKSFG